MVPLDRQAALPPGILYQPDWIGGSLGFGGRPEFKDLWDKLKGEAAALVPPVMPPGLAGSPNLKQSLQNFLFQATVVSQLVVPYNAARVYLMVENIGAANVFVSFGKEATTADSFRIAGNGGFYEPIFGTTSSVHCVAAAGIQNVVIIEGFRAGQ
jgi:hypothetical protein